MIGPHLIYLHPALVALVFQLNMLCHAQKAVFRHCVTTRSELNTRTSIRSVLSYRPPHSPFAAISRHAWSSVLAVRLFIDSPVSGCNCGSTHTSEQISVSKFAFKSPSVYRTHERMKKRAYQQRVLEVEHASFAPLVLSATGGMANETTLFYKRIASRLSEKMGSTIQYHNGLANLQNHFCISAFCHSMATTSKIEQRSCHQT